MEDRILFAAQKTVVENEDTITTLLKYVDGNVHEIAVRLYEPDGRTKLAEASWLNIKDMKRTMHQIAEFVTYDFDVAAEFSMEIRS